MQKGSWVNPLKNKWLWAWLVVINVWVYLAPFRYTLTQSVPYRVFYLAKADIQKGHYVLFKRKPEDISKYGFIRETIKQVIGVPGDVVELKGREFLINGQSIGFAKETTSSGIPLSLGPTGVIPDGHVFVYGVHPDSLDSRYEAMGWVSKDAIRAHAVPLW